MLRLFLGDEKTCIGVEREREREREAGTQERREGSRRVEREAGKGRTAPINVYDRQAIT